MKHGKSSTNTIRVTRNCEIYTNDIEEVKKVCKNLYGNENKYAGSALCSGTQWDVMMHFVNDKLDGNNEKFNVRSPVSSRHNNNDDRTGTCSVDFVQNIFDLEGNFYEFVAEKNTSPYMQGRPFVTRSGGDGGSYDDKCGASTRYNAKGVASEYGAVRLVLYVK